MEFLLDMATHGGAKVMGAMDYGLAVGCRADLVVVPGDTPTEAVINLPPRTYVFKAGRLVAGGADVNLADGSGVTPLAHAHQRGFTEIIDILEEAGAQ